MKVNKNVNKFKKIFQQNICKLHQKITKEHISGGMLRQLRGHFVENTISTIIKKINNNLDIKMNDKITIVTKKGNTKIHGTDIHVYDNGVLKSVIECKSYIDACYYERACMDMKIFKNHNKSIKTIVISLEDSIKPNTKNFYDEIFNNSIDKLYILTEYKRNSKKPLWLRYKQTKSNNNRLINCINDLINQFK